MMGERSGACRVLIIDDDRIQIDLISGFLEALSFDLSTEHALTIDEAVVSINELPPDIIFLDNRMPPEIDYRNGLNLIREAGYGGPVIINSVTIDDPILRETRKSGVTRVMDKFELREDTLRELISTFWPDRRAERVEIGTREQAGAPVSNTLGEAVTPKLHPRVRRSA